MLTITQPKPTSQEIARRAVELGRMNGHKEADAVYSELAQAEADEGNTHHWTWMCDGNMLAYLQNALTTAEVYGDYATRVALRSQIEALEAKKAADAAKVAEIAPAPAPVSSWSPGVSPAIVAQTRKPIRPARKPPYTRMEYMVRQRWASAWNADRSKMVEIEVNGTLEEAESAVDVAFLRKFKEHSHGLMVTTTPPRKQRAA